MIDAPCSCGEELERFFAAFIGEFNLRAFLRLTIGRIYEIKYLTCLVAPERNILGRFYF
jgi:hypothetical protein